MNTKVAFPRLRWNCVWTMFVVLVLGSSATTALAAARRCSGMGGSSVWCHTYWYGETTCNIYDRNGDEVVHDVDGGLACAAIQN
ncbi:MAG: hypothetical protein HY014_13380 [Acidobacteria bacterium]|nr:hypothetical protein [Acidobacteriota bacterium]MBI3489148.1 hypothetical protein [Acidobacteriota bacterium]